MRQHLIPPLHTRPDRNHVRSLLLRPLATSRRGWYVDARRREAVLRSGDPSLSAINHFGIDPWSVIRALCGVLQVRKGWGDGEGGRGVPHCARCPGLTRTCTRPTTPPQTQGLLH